jgi:hypothetical protein
MYVEGDWQLAGSGWNCNSSDRSILTRTAASQIEHITRGSVRNTRGLGPTMTARGQSIGISIGMLPQTLIMSRLDQLSRLDARI